MLALMGQLSNLFSKSEIPYIHYRIVENMFCKYFNAENLSRNDISYDAVKNGVGIGIKTFLLPNGVSSVEKIAEFNNLSSELKGLSNIDLARKVSEYRNDRILLADKMCVTSSRKYHIVGRKKGELVVFDSPYDLIDIDNICDAEDNKGKTISFNDGVNEYTFNNSKSVLMKRFHVSKENLIVPVNIMEDPYIFMENLLSIDDEISVSPEISVVLPLYSERKGGYVPDKSGLNKWNAGGRNRDENEVYIAIPSAVRSSNPDFFPDKNTPFSLHLPDGRIISAKVCQDGCKGIMSNPNKDLGKWILRDLMNIPVGQLVTMNDLNRLGFNSVLVTKIDSLNFRISASYDKNYAETV